jgi:T-complex protein 1 subunit alpha
MAHAYSVAAINVLKVHGRSSLESYLVDGYALNTMRSAQGMPTCVGPAKVACIDFNLQRHRMQMGVSMIVNDPAELEKIKKREADITKERIQKIIDAGANVIVTTKAIDDLCAKYLVEAGVIGLRRVTKRDLQRLARATGAKVLSNLADLDGEESCDASALGACDEVSEEMVADQPFIFFKKCEGSGAATIVLRGANDFMLDEVERSLHDSLMVVKRTMESRKVVAGGGSVETACSVHLEDFATRLGTREQLAVQEFSEALLVIPKTLAVNAAQDASELVAKLRAMHSASQQDASKAELKFRGLELVKGKVIDTLAAGVLEPALAKVKSLRFATEAAITIMRIDDHIKLNPKEDPNGGRR